MKTERLRKKKEWLKFGFYELGVIIQEIIYNKIF